MRDIKHGKMTVATIGNLSDIKDGKYFSPDPLAPLQYGLFKLAKGEILQRHIHKVRSRLKKHKTLEFLFVCSGELETTFYSLEKAEITKVVLKQGDFVMLYDGGHGFKVLKDNTVFIEVKNGQFVSTEADKERW